MATRRKYDPLSAIPSPDVVQRHLTETESLAQRLRILLGVSRQIHANNKPLSQEPAILPVHQLETLAHAG